MAKFRNMIKKNYGLRKMLAIAALAIVSLNYGGSMACTSAIVSAEASASGRPLLWKHRDTSTTDNKVEYVPAEDGAYAYVALFNAKDRKLEEAWTGMNEKGFAIMNTASYNIKADNVAASKMDKEGIVMTLALRTCVTVEDFEKLLDAYPRPMGVEANFGVIDAYGNGAFYETNNTSYVKYDLKDAPGGVIIRTNYSHSGRSGEGYGYIREANAEKLLAPHIEAADITPEFLTETVSRSFYHDLRGEDALLTGERWAIDEDFIPRYKSTATIVIEGCVPLKKGENPESEFIIPEYVMWTGLGYPPCAEIVPVWCHKNGVADELRGLEAGGTSKMGNVVKARRGEAFPKRKGGNTRYIDTQTLRNESGTGYLQTLVPKNLETYSIIKRKRDAGEISFAE